MNGFWDTLPRPFFVLAPLANVTDAAFRRIIAKYSRYGGRDIDYMKKPATIGVLGGPDVMFTEFISADGLIKGDWDAMLLDLKYTECERPIVAQFFTSTPYHMEQAAILAKELGFDGVDINMGCPDRSIERQKAGAMLMRDLERAKELIVAAKRGAGGLPVSVKTRIGYYKNEIERWLPALLVAKPAAISIHARTRKEMSKVDAHWDVMGRAVEIRNELKSETRIIGNGDVRGLDDAREKARTCNVDGVMIGRGVFGNPWFFSPEQGKMVSAEKKVVVMLEHASLFVELFSGKKNYETMKRHFKSYVNGFRGANILRAQLMTAKTHDEVRQIATDFMGKNF